MPPPELPHTEDLLLDFDKEPLEEPHIFHEIPEVLAFNATNRPQNKNVKLVGVYKASQGDHYLTTFVEFKDQKVEQIALDMSLVNEFPAIDSNIELYGALNFDLSTNITVYFWSDLGHESDLIRKYLQCLRAFIT